MPILGSITNGIYLLELIADAGGPVSTPELIKTCHEKFNMSEATVRNTLDTLVHHGWLWKDRQTGGMAHFGLGQKPAKIWRDYILAGLKAVKEKHREAEEKMRGLEELEDFGGDE